jgi:hypothetical protein
VLFGESALGLPEHPLNVGGKNKVSLPDPETTKLWIEISAAAVGALKKAKELLPHAKDKEEIERLSLELEQRSKEAQARLATELGFDLCSRCWPPEVMLIGDDDTLECRHCGKPPPRSDHLPGGE